MAIVYGIMLVVAIVLLILYCSLIKAKEPWLVVLFACVCIVNLGYLLLSTSNTVNFALFANKIAYLGQIFLLISTYLTIAKLCGLNLGKTLPIILIMIGVVVFAMICTTGYLPWYYKSVTIEFANGAAKLVKEYGPLHVVYLIYVLSYFVLMLVTVIWAIHTQKVGSRKQSGLLVAIVVCNITTWLVEKIIPLNFEFLSVSYVLTVSMLFFLYWMMQDYVHKNDVPVVNGAPSTVVIVDNLNRAEKLRVILEKLPQGVKLTTRQTEILEGILDGKSRREIAVDLHLSENTVKTHTATLYEVLGVTCREEIFQLFNNA